MAETEYPENDPVVPGKLTRREKVLLKRMDQDDKHDSRMARRDAANERKAAKRAGKKVTPKRKGK
jgi:hypothetical protein